MRLGAMTKLHGKGFKHPWPPLIKVDETAKAKKWVEKFFE
jgi:hypothetical protein